MPITQKELARMFGVSQMTVSRALRGQAGVKADLRARIVTVANEQGYSPEANHAARALRRRAHGQQLETNVVCVMVPRDDDHDAYSFHGRLAAGICAGAEEMGMEVVMAAQHTGALPLVVLRRQVDGVIRLMGEAEYRSHDFACPAPWVSLLHEVPDADVVTVDGQAGMRELGRHLVGLGHRRFAYIGPTSELSQARLAGLRDAVAAGGAELPNTHVRLLQWAGNAESVNTLMAQLEADGALAGDRRPTALVVYNDFMAVAAMHWLRDRRLRVPEDISVAGFDGALPRGERGQIVTSMGIPLEQLGRDATRLLGQRLAHPHEPWRRLVLATSLIRGATAGPPPKESPRE